MMMPMADGQPLRDPFAGFGATTTGALFAHAAGRGRESTAAANRHDPPQQDAGQADVAGVAGAGEKQRAHWTRR